MDPTTALREFDIQLDLRDFTHQAARRLEIPDNFWSENELINAIEEREPRVGEALRQFRSAYSAWGRTAPSNEQYSMASDAMNAARTKLRQALENTSSVSQ